MRTNLNLVVNNMLLSEQTAGVPKSIRVADHNNLVPKHNLSMVGAEKRESSYRMLVMVILAHLFGIAALVTTKTQQVKIQEMQTPIQVSLVSNPIIEPKVAPIVPATQVPTKSKKTLFEKQKLPIVEKAIKEITTEERVNEPQPILESAAAESAGSIKAIETLAEVTPVNAQADPVVEPPRFGAAYLNNPAPAYPPLARRLSEQGRVLLKVLVTEEGLAAMVQIDTSSGYNKLDQAAIEAVKKWSFIPAKRSNQPISAYVLVPIKFSLNS
ncbi:MAG: energy transducer TonB [Methylotenera sp.]|nr:energy transducer TonB [Methylotenera sp.]